MRLTRGLVLLVALSSAAGAALLVQRAVRIVPRPAVAAKLEVVDILVAAKPITVGEMVGKDEVRWQPWPRAAVPAGSIRREVKDSAAAPLPFEAAPARFAFLEGEPISEAKLTGAEQGSALAALLAPGMRAVSVPIRDETAAGGFIQPGDRVDVMVTRKSADGPGAPSRSKVLLRSVRVLAIGRTLQGKSSAAGRTATLELSPDEASLFTAAQSAGEITLALIGTQDAAGAGTPTALLSEPADIRMLKYGRSTNRPTSQ